MPTHNRIADQFEQVTTQAQETLESHPLTFVAAAFGLGLVLGVVAVVSFGADRSPPSLRQRIGERFLDLVGQINPMARGE